ncbi:ATP-binding cassette domain-containing protein [Geminocystis sp. GBBB08]|uniref:ATP-binding cassette domain-containing protein n=1 Tax=Geminocystis sp. GBBB08 TaxID=2604140 RepID=UPI0027E28455|nr:ATP-binding cassette domain-containing protein [Geminocystis sp. GBBB08]
MIIASIRRVMGLLDTPIAIHSGNKTFSTSVKGEISIVNVDFSYDNGVKVLKNLSMDIRAKSNIGIVGATGSGKSTLVKLLLRFYEIDHGKITIDGINIQELYLHDLRLAIA